MTRELLKQWVEARIDEVLPRNDAGVVQVLIESPANFIDQELDPSAEYILRNAPREVIFEAVVEDNDVTVDENEDGSGVITMPSNFLRFITLKFDDWRRPLTSLISQDDPRYKLQFNAYQKGTKHKPVAALIQTGEKKYGIEYFSSEEHTIESFRYVPVTVAENMPGTLDDPLAWYCASRVLMIMKQNEASVLAKNTADQLIKEIKFGILGE